MNLFDMLAGPQGGNGVEALARQFNLSPQQAQGAVEALLPAFSQGFRQNTADAGGLGAFLQALGSGQHAKYGDDVEQALTPAGIKEGNGILGNLFGSKEVSRSVAAQASQASGVPQNILQQMLPAIASMLMGALFNQTNRKVQKGKVTASNPLGQIIEQLTKQQGGGGQGSQGSGNPLGDILGQILGGGQGGGRSQGGGNNPLGDILGQVLGGGQSGGQSRSAPQGGNNPLGDILGQVLGGGQGGGQTRRAPQGGGNNPLGDILGQILGGGQPQPQEQYEEEQPRRSQPQRRQQRQAPQGNPLEDIFGKMFNPGGQGRTAQTEEYQQGVNDIFEQFRRGVDRQTR